MKLYCIVYFLTWLLCLSCINKSKRNNVDNEVFAIFYTKFHSDSVFQLNRIKFPLPGINTDEMDIEDTIYFWEKEKWEIHKSFNIDTSLFKVEKKISDTLVSEKIYQDSSGFIIERKFELIKGKWFLTQYKNVNL